MTASIGVTRPRIAKASRNDLCVYTRADLRRRVRKLVVRREALGAQGLLQRPNLSSLLALCPL
jgi:hypothetical protein